MKYSEKNFDKSYKGVKENLKRLKDNYQSLYSIKGSIVFDEMIKLNSLLHKTNPKLERLIRKFKKNIESRVI